MTPKISNLSFYSTQHPSLPLLPPAWSDSEVSGVYKMCCLSSLASLYLGPRQAQCQYECRYEREIREKNLN